MTTKCLKVLPEETRQRIETIETALMLVRWAMQEFEPSPEELEEARWLVSKLQLEPVALLGLLS